jgi:hypothetical protein
VTVPQATPAHDAVTFGTQHELPWHSCPMAAQVSVHWVGCPQLFLTVPQATPLQAAELFGVQQAPW